MDRQPRFSVEHKDNGVVVITLLDRKILDEQNIQIIGE